MVNMTIMSVFAVFMILYVSLSLIRAENLYAASIYWRPVGADEIVLSYRLIWEQDSVRLCPPPNTSPLCAQLYLTGTSSVTLNPFTSRWNGLSLMCTSGCAGMKTISNLSALYYSDISTFHEISWESAMEIKSLKFNSANDNTASIRIGFQYANGSLLDGLGEGHLSMATRNDTKRANISPVVNTFPVYRVPLGCSIDIKLFPFDGDGDFVKCHRETFPTLGSAESHVILNEDTCEMTITADAGQHFQVNQSLHLSLYAEDYSYVPVQFSGVSNDISSGPFSRAPIKILVYIGKALQNPKECTKGPSFNNDGTLVPNLRKSYGIKFNNSKLPFLSPSNTDTILTSGPRHMMFVEDPIEWAQIDNSTKREEGTWNNINDRSLEGIHQACGMTYTDYGVPGESRCAILMVNDPDECVINPCTKQPGGVCNNLFQYNTCTYPSIPPHNGSTQPLCKPAGTGKEGNDDLGLKVGLPVGLSLLLLIIIVATAAYLKRYWMDKMMKSTVEPQGAAEESTKGLADKIINAA